MARVAKVRRDVQAVIFDESDGEKKVLLVKKPDFSVRRHRWRLLKGGVESGETETEALKREILEELGLKNVQVMGRVHSYEFVFKDTRHLVSSYPVKGDSEETIRLQRSEVIDYAWMPMDEAVETLFWNNEKEAVRRLKAVLPG